MLVIKKVGKESADNVADIISKSFEQQAQILGINKIEYPNYAAFETAEMIRNRIENGENVMFAWLNEIPVGTVRYNVDINNPKRGFINRLAVLPEYRGNSYGKVLLEFAESKLIQSGVEEIFISIVKRFERLEKYYKDQGYKYLRDQTFSTLPFEVRFLVKDIKIRGGF